MEGGARRVARPAARVLLLDPGGSLLLLRMRVPETGYTWWSPPGGGLLAGETHEQAARREVLEETGLAGFELGPWVWARRHHFPWNGTEYDQTERYFVALTPSFEARPGQLTEAEFAMITGARWWTAAEIAAAPDRFAPPGLGPLLAALLRDGPPSGPLDLDAGPGGKPAKPAPGASPGRS